MKTFLLAAILIMPTAWAGFSQADWASAVNVSGRQRMLSQKMAKEFGLVLLGIDTEKNKSALSGTINEFETKLNELISKSPEDKITAQLNKVKGLWTPYKDALQTMSKDKLEFVYKNSKIVLKEMNKGVKLYEVASVNAGVKAKGKVINIAGKQRMLTQKMSKEAFFSALGHKPKKTQKAAAKTAKDFSKALDALINGNTQMRVPAADKPNLKAQLTTVQGLWDAMKPSIDKVAGGDVSEATLKDIASKNIPLLKEMNKAVGMYE